MLFSEKRPTPEAGLALSADTRPHLPGAVHAMCYFCCTAASALALASARAVL
jgi:hypothetical protein